MLTTYETDTSVYVQPSSPSFPVDVLPETTRRFVMACSQSLSAAPELVAIPALAVAAAAIGTSRSISLKQDWSEAASLFAAVVSPSGTMKSPALKMAAQPLIDLDTTQRRTWTTDVTVERLAGLLAENPRGLLLLRDELTAWVKSMNQYRQGKGSDRQFYLSVWGGAPVRVDRKGEPAPISIARPCLSVVGCIPPEVIHDLEHVGQEDGFLPRLLFAWPSPVPVRWSENVVPVELREAYANRIRELFALPEGSLPINLTLTGEAHERFRQWHDHHCADTEDPNLPSFLRGVYAKLKGYCPRLALIHTLLGNPAVSTVEQTSIEAAIAMVEYFKTQAGQVMLLLGHGGMREVERCKAEIRRKLSVYRSIKKRDLQRNSAFSADVFNQALVELQSPGVIQDANGILRLWEPTNRQPDKSRPLLDDHPSGLVKPALGSPVPEDT